MRIKYTQLRYVSDYRYIVIIQPSETCPRCEVSKKSDYKLDYFAWSTWNIISLLYKNILKL